MFNSIIMFMGGIPSSKTISNWSPMEFMNNKSMYMSQQKELQTKLNIISDILPQIDLLEIDGVAEKITKKKLKLLDELGKVEYILQLINKTRSC